MRSEIWTIIGVVSCFTVMPAAIFWLLPKFMSEAVVWTLGKNKAERAYWRSIERKLNEPI